jgi:hypothetical protein
LMSPLSSTDASPLNGSDRGFGNRPNEADLVPGLHQTGRAVGP